jgi:Flp pilus assembly protein TadG
MRVRGGRVGLSDERGGVVLTVAISLIAIMGMLVLVIDLGGMALKHRAMVNAADAAALAAAQSCSVPSETAYDAKNNPLHGADVVAQQNVSGAVAYDGTEGFNDHGKCGAASGSVTVKYHAPQSLFFAPILGFGNSATITTTATASWGVASGGGGSAPMELDASQLRNCFPSGDYSNGAIGTVCTFWWNNDDIAGNSQWGLVNLDTWGIAGNAQCNSVGSTTRDSWITYGYPGHLNLNPPPAPTYVCLNPGATTSNWQTLRTRIGKIELFPVNDATKQVSRYGTVCTDPEDLAGTCAVDKYDMVGFIQLKIISVLDGNDPLVMGTPGVPGTNGSCSTSVNFSKSGATYDLTKQNCKTTNLHYPDPAPLGDSTKLFPKLSTTSGNTTTVYRINTDYTYNTTAKVITWLKSKLSGVTIAWVWDTPAVPPTPGMCGSHYGGDPNAKCMVTEYEGPRPSGGGLGDGGDCQIDPNVICNFGSRGIDLSG